MSDHVRVSVALSTVFVVIALTLIFSLGVLNTNTSGPPSVIGMNISAAETALRDAGYRYVVKFDPFGPRKYAFTIRSESLIGHESSSPGAIVRLTAWQFVVLSNK